MPLAALLKRFRSPPGAALAAADAGWIRFDLEPALGYSLRLHLAPWESDSPFHWRSEAGGEWIASGGFMEGPGIGWGLLEETHGPELMRGMPASVRRAIAAAPFLGVELAQVCGALSAARELATSSPLLLILLVEWASENGLTRPELAGCLAQKQPVICDSVGLPGSQATAKLTRRCALRPMIRRELLELRRTLNRPDDSSLLRHYQALCLEHLVFLARYEGPRWPGLLAVVDGILEAQQPRAGQAAWLHRLLADTERMFNGSPQALQRVANLQDLHTLHDRLVDQFNDQFDQAGRASSAAAIQSQYGDYPSPPLPGHGELAPVDSWEGLLKEGQRMRHCVGSYHRAVAAGRIAIYHLSSPEPVTVAIQTQGGGWGLREAKGRYNAMPSAEAQRQIQNWLSSASSS